MDLQSIYPTSFEQGSRTSLFPHQSEEYEIDIINPIIDSQGGAAMYRDHSNESHYSTYSLSPNLSPNAMSYGRSSPALDYESTCTVYGNRDVTNSSHVDEYLSTRQPLEQDEEVRHTPDSLGWSSQTELLKLYEFKVPKGRQPYLELSPRWNVTLETPRIVYLSSGPTVKGVHICKFPNGCAAHFKRPADLDRHYTNVHACDDQKQRFPCDYIKCPRSTDFFTRKDHYRDHLKDYHKEDIGSAKKTKNLSDKEWRRTERRWREERQITPNWWRCVKCLLRVKDSWSCPECKQPCEPKRITARQQMAQNLTPPLQSTDEVAFPTYGDDQDHYSTSYLKCTTCQASGWIASVDGTCWEPCHDCRSQSTIEPATSPYYRYQEYNSASYQVSYAT